MASKAQLQAALKSALRYIASQHREDFTDEDGDSVEDFREGNLFSWVVDNDFGEFEFDFKECLGLLESDGVTIEGPANRKQCDFRGFLQQFNTREGAEKAMNKIMEVINGK